MVLEPNIDSIPFFHGSAPAEARRREYEAHGCGNIREYHKEQIPEICKKYYSSIGAYVFGGGLCKFFYL